MRTEKILVLTGGESETGEVSRRSSAHILQALQNLGYTTAEMEMSAAVPRFLAGERPDLVFLALCGAGNENGALQGFLEVMGIPYTGSGIAASAVCTDKILTRKVLTFEEIPTPEFAILNQIDLADGERVMSDLLDFPGLPLVVKPARQGFRHGASLVKEPQELKTALDKAFDYDHQVLVEKYIRGVEVTVGIMGNREAYLLPVLEVVPEAGDWFDTDCKYNEDGSHYISPPRLPQALLRKVEALAQASYERLGCRGCARIDIMAEPQASKAYVLEVNTIPAMTPSSLLPGAVKAAGMSWEEFIDRMVRLALQQRQTAGKGGFN